MSVEAAYYNQMGKASHDYTSGVSIPINAWMASLKTTYIFIRELIGYAGYDNFGGDKEFVISKQGSLALLQHSKMSAFTSIFGSTHKFYGAMDFFYVSTYFGTFSPGIQNVYVGGIYKPYIGLSIDASSCYCYQT